MGIFDKWWSSLKVAEKERIASKIAGRRVVYPECTEIWQGLSVETQLPIYEHCTGRHGDVMKAHQEGKMYSE